MSVTGAAGPQVGDRWDGYCHAHRGPAVFEVQHAWLRDGLVCTGCAAIPRTRAVSLVLQELFPGWRNAWIWEIAPSGALSDRLKAEGTCYLGTHYWPDVRPGDEKWGYVCQDVEATTFRSGTFDVVVSQDVFEHVFDVERGMSEIARVLKPGGRHVFTVPRKRDLPVSRPRAVRTAEGVRHLEAEEYHGNPVDESGSLVTYDWGLDLEDVIERAAGLTTTSVRLESRRLGILGEFLEVFVSTKSGVRSSPRFSAAAVGRYLFGQT